MTAAQLAAAGVLTAAQISRTAAGVRQIQRPDGAIPWCRGDKLDPWDHVEAAMALDAAGEHEAAARAYEWLVAAQNPDGSWHAYYADVETGAASGRVTDPTRDTNFTAYIAVGAYHHYRATGDRQALKRLWRPVSAAVEFVLCHQRPDGAIRWHADTDEALLTGSSSVYLALRCALAAAADLGDSQPGWELAAAELGHALRVHPERFVPKERYSMDWYYPVLGTAVRGAAAHARIDSGWERFVRAGLGVRCVDDRPWVTGGETCELAIALWALGRPEQARQLVADAAAWLRDDEDGLYWTGYVYADEMIWPEEKTSWTAGSVLLALAVLGGEPATRDVFGGVRLPTVPAVECVAERCVPLPG
jgi:hypothetical protein